MIISFRDLSKLLGISVIACCAVFVCTLFLNYNADIVSIESQIETDAALSVYNAQVSMGKVTVAVTGGCLAATSVVMLMFYVKNFIDSHSKELGILKALGYADMSIAKRFCIFGLSVLLGCAVGYMLAYMYMPRFYELQNAEKLFPDCSVAFHPWLFLCLTVLPAAFFSLISVVYAYFRLRLPTVDLIKERTGGKVSKYKSKKVASSFLTEFGRGVLASKKTLVFLVMFSSFCFSAMVQMSISMKSLSSVTFAVMIISIGLILAFTTLFLALLGVVKGNIKSVAMMKALGYASRDCGIAVFKAYMPVALAGFAVGTVYQYALLKTMIEVIFADAEVIFEYSFDTVACAVTFAIFLAAYGLMMYLSLRRFKRFTVKDIMSE